MDLPARLLALQEERGCCVDVDDILGAIYHRTADVPIHKALGDRKRLLMFHMIAHTPALCACEFQAALQLSHATVSHHAKVLAEAGLIIGERRGPWVHYRLTEAGKRWRGKEKEIRTDQSTRAA